MQNTRVKEYFLTENNRWKCKVCAEQKPAILVGNVSHLKNHLHSKHKDIAIELGISERRRVRNNNHYEGNGEENAIFVSRKKVKFDFDINDTVRDFIKSILMRNLPITVADDMGKNEMIRKALQAFGVRWNRQKAKEFILKAAEQIYEIIAKDIENVYPSLMFDSASRFNTNVFSASIRYTKDGKLHDRTLGMLTQHGRQLGVVLADQLITLIAKVGKGADDIYSTCSDQGKNMIKASDAIREMQNQMIVCNEFVEEAQQFVFEDFDLLDRVNFEEELVENSEDTDDGIERLSHTQEQERKINVLENNIGAICTKMFCGAHVCQLAAKDVTKPFEATLAEIRKFIRNTQAPKYDAIFADLKRPRKDIAPRLSSTYIMVSDMFEKLAIYEQVGTNRNNRELRLNDETWKFIEEYARTFEPIFYAMKDFQRSDFTMSDFFLRWMRMMMNLEKIADGQNNLTSKLLEALNLRSQRFFECDAFIAALILDPRFAWNSASHEVFNDLLRSRGVDHLLKIHHFVNSQRQLAEIARQPENLRDEDEERLTQLSGRDFTIIQYMIFNQYLISNGSLNKFYLITLKKSRISTLCTNKSSIQLNNLILMIFIIIEYYSFLPFFFFLFFTNQTNIA